METGSRQIVKQAHVNYQKTESDMLPAIQGTLYHPNHEYSDQKLSLLIYKPIVQSDIL